MKSIVLAFSGGLDTSFCIPYLKETFEAEIHAVFVDCNASDGPIDTIARACGNIDVAAENILSFVGAVFYRYHHHFEEAMICTANQGGCSGAVGFYLGSLIGALHGPDVLPNHWLNTLKVKESVEASVVNYVH